MKTKTKTQTKTKTSQRERQRRIQRQEQRQGQRQRHRQRQRPVKKKDKDEYKGKGDNQNKDKERGKDKDKDKDKDIDKAKAKDKDKDKDKNKPERLQTNQKPQGPNKKYKKYNRSVFGNVLVFCFGNAFKEGHCSPTPLIRTTQPSTRQGVSRLPQVTKAMPARTQVLRPAWTLRLKANMTAPGSGPRNSEVGK